MASKKNNGDVITSDQAELFMTQYAKASTELKRIEAEIEKKKLSIHDAYTDQVAELQLQQNEAFEKLEVYCEAHPEMFEDKRSHELTSGRMGYQTGQPKLATMKGFTWASVLPLVKSKLKDFLRTKTEVDKASLLAKRDDKAIVKKMNACGIEVVQDELFFIESFEESLVSA